MQALASLIPLVATVSLAALVLAVGLDSTLQELLALFRQPARLLKAILAVNVIVPVGAIVLVSLLPLTPAVRGGLMLMAVSPVPPLVPGKQLKVGGSKTYGYALYTALILLAVVTVPVTVAVISHIYGVEVPLSPFAVARSVAVGVVAPLVAGVIIHRFAPRFAERMSPVLRKTAMLLVLVVVIPILVTAWPMILKLVGNGTLLAMALLSVIALAAGHLLGGPNLADRATLAVTAATRHPGIAIMIAQAGGRDKRTTAAILATLLVSLLVGALYQAWLKRLRAAGPAAQGASLAQ